MKAGFLLGNFTGSLVIMNVAKFLIELRAVSCEVLLESIGIVHVLLEKGHRQRKYSRSYCHSRPHSDYLFADSHDNSEAPVLKHVKTE